MPVGVTRVGAAVTLITSDWQRQRVSTMYASARPTAITTPATSRIIGSEPSVCGWIVPRYAALTVVQKASASTLTTMPTTSRSTDPWLPSGWATSSSAAFASNQRGATPGKQGPFGLQPEIATRSHRRVTTVTVGR